MPSSSCAGPRRKWGTSWNISASPSIVSKGAKSIKVSAVELILFQARATLLATGGAGRIFQSSTNAYITTGDGLGMAARAGIPLEDMEFFLFHPTGVYGAGER